MGFFLGLISSATFGLIPLFTLPLIHDGVSPASVLFYRFLIASLTLGGVLVLRRERFHASAIDLCKLAGMSFMYTAAALLRFYGLEAGELLSEKNPDFNLFLDPKADWALRHLEQFPVEVNCASYEELLRVPGIGVKSARRIVQARRSSRLEYQHLKKIGVVLKRAIYFITCNGKMMYRIPIEEEFITKQLTSVEYKENWQLMHQQDYHQMSLFGDFGVQA